VKAAEKLVPKQERLLLARFEAVLKRYKIDPAAYHGGDSTGNAIKHLMKHAPLIFGEFLDVLNTIADGHEYWDDSEKKKRKDEAKSRCDAFSNYFDLADSVFQHTPQVVGRFCRR
jgi:hypothetical protein